MKRRTFLKGLFATTVALPGLPSLAMVEQDYSFTITKVEVVRSESNFSRLVRGMATLDNSPDGKEHNCYFVYEVIDNDMSIENSFDNAHDDIRSHFINKFGG